MMNVQIKGNNQRESTQWTSNSNKQFKIKFN